MGFSSFDCHPDSVLELSSPGHPHVNFFAVSLERYFILQLHWNSHDWLPIHDWTTEQVWKTIREHGDIVHPAYKLPGGAANERLSCALCILASLNDLINGAVHNPDIYREYCHIEAVTGYSFRQGLWLSDLKPELLPESTLTAVQLHKQRKSS